MVFAVAPADTGLSHSWIGIGAVPMVYGEKRGRGMMQWIGCEGTTKEWPLLALRYLGSRLMRSTSTCLHLIKSELRGNT